MKSTLITKINLNNDLHYQPDPLIQLFSYKLVHLFASTKQSYHVYLKGNTSVTFPLKCCLTKILWCPNINVCH